MKITTYDEYKNTKCPFGKYKGKTLNNIPIDYIKWVVMNHSDRGIATMFSIELMRRETQYRKK